MTPQQAYRLVRTALDQGSLVRPSSCERCGTVPRFGADGRSTIHAHHSDYERPLDVEWLCAGCHREETPLPEKMGAPAFGERNGQARLTYAAVEEIRSSSLTKKALAERFGVHPKTIQKVRNRKYWLAAAPAEEVKP